MCGIVGVISFEKPVTIFQKFIEWANDSMYRRGPDAKGIWTNSEDIILGFRRLAIRDTSSLGNQPMLSLDKNHVIVFNGEIYNIDPIKKNLQNLGYRFISTTDTEVLLYALVEWDIDSVLSMIDGIFAFAYYDQRKKSLILARDRPGIKPLYIGESKEGIVFSSEYDHIINHPYCSNNSIDGKAITNYLQLGYVPEKAGAYEKTYLIPHGHYLTINSEGTSNLREYFNYSSTKLEGSFSEGLIASLSDSVQSQLVSDVPLGTFLSGGVDSPLITFFAQKSSKACIGSYTIGVDDKKFDESEAALEFSKLFSTNHREWVISEDDFLGVLKTNFSAFSEPFADYSSIPTLLLCQFAKKEVTVALSGDGGDELFWGYSRNVNTKKKVHLFNKPKGSLWINFLVEKIRGKERLITKKELMSRSFLDYYYQSLFIRSAPKWVSKISSSPSSDPYFFKKIRDEWDNKDIKEEEMIFLIRKLEFDLHLQRILLKVDRASMFNSLEVRVPFLSNKMLEFSQHIDHERCIQNGTGKYLLKELLSKSSNPNLVFRPKKGFTVPISSWLRNRLKDDVKEKILDMPSGISQLFDKKQVEKMLFQFFDRGEKLHWLTWSIYSFVKWYDLHVGKDIKV